MSIVLTYWEKPKYDNDPDSFDGICSIVLKTVKDIPSLIANKPEHCAMISIERGSAVLKRDKSGPTNPLNPKHFKELWRKGEPLPATPIYPRVCPCCRREL